MLDVMFCVRACVRFQSFQSKSLAGWFGDIIEKNKSDVHTLADC